MGQNRWFRAKGPQAAKLRRRKYTMIRQLGFPEDALGGSLSQTFRRCGKTSCHCATGKGHPMWVLSFSVDGSKHTEVIPEDWVPELEPLIEQGRQCRAALTEFLSLNVELFRLWKQEQRARAAKVSASKANAKRRPASKKRGKSRKRAK